MDGGLNPPHPNLPLKGEGILSLRNKPINEGGGSAKMKRKNR